MFASFIKVWVEIKELLSQIAAIRSEVRDDTETIKTALEVYKVLSAYSLEMKHFVGITSDNHKFVFCPIAPIVSWSEGDYDHKWCHYCKEFFDAPRIMGMPVKVDAKLKSNEIRFDHPDGRSEGFKL